MNTATIAILQKAMGTIGQLWVFAWNQLLALASGADTYKLPLDTEATTNL
jgi:heterodisulfide reductase subunit B